jgi:uncharacterized protein
MIIDTFKISDKDFFVNDSIELDENFLLEDDAFFLAPVDYNVSLVKEGDKIKAKGKIKTSISIKCVRCLENFDLKINSSFDIILFPINLIEITSTSLDAEEMEYIFYEGNKIDITKILIEQINLYIPFKPICKSKCQGICPNCGANLNLDKCECENFSDDLNLFKKKVKR